MKIAIVGSPKSGKTTFSNSLDGNVKHTDDLISLGWSEISENASYWFDDDTVNVVEGVAVARALRKWLARNKLGKPVEKIIFLVNPPFQKLSDGQLRMAKGIVTVWDGIVGELLSRGVVIEKKSLTQREPDKRDSAPSQAFTTPEVLSDLEGLS